MSRVPRGKNNEFVLFARVLAEGLWQGTISGGRSLQHTAASSANFTFFIVHNFFVVT